LADAQLRQGRVPVLLLGPDERGWVEEIKAALPDAKLPLQEARLAAEIAASPLYTMALGARLSAAVANDSGAGHLLAASGVAMVSLFGPTRAAKFAPAARRLELVEAQRFGGDAMEAIPLEVVNAAIERSLVN
jgi:ADP-heptose:LPS heptosyltransferase